MRPAEDNHSTKGWRAGETERWRDELMDEYVDGVMNRQLAAQYMLRKVNSTPFLPKGNVATAKNTIENDCLKDALIQ